MARGDPLYAHLEVGFFLNDPRFTRLTPAEKVTYLAFWCTAVEYRTEHLPPYVDMREICKRAALDVRTCRKCVSTLQQTCGKRALIERAPDGGFIVVGCRVKHKNLRNWKDVETSPNGEKTGPSVTEAVTVTESKTSEPPAKKPRGEPPKPRFQSDDMKAARWMFEGVKRISPHAREPKFESWANTIRLMRERDRITYDDLRAVFGWANQDDFWAVNILSPSKLREKWEALSARMNQRPKQDPASRGRVIPKIEKREGFSYTIGWHHWMEQRAGKFPNRNRAKAEIMAAWPSLSPGQDNPDGLHLEDIMRKLKLVDEATENHQRRSDAP